MPNPPKKWSLRRYIVAGILIWLPILATLWVVTFFIHIMDETLLLLPPSYRPQALMGFALPGLGAVFAFIVVLLTGLLVTNLVGRRLVGVWEDAFEPDSHRSQRLRRGSKALRRASFRSRTPSARS